MDAQKTHFADDETLKHIARLQALNAELVSILSKITRANDSGNNGSVMGEAMLCEAFAIEARSVLAKSKEAQS